MDHIVENLIGSLLDAQHDYAEESIDSLKNDRKEVYIFGAGAAGKLIKQDLDRFEIPVYRFVDNDVKKVGTRIEGVPVIGFQELVMAQKPKKIIIGTVAFHDEIVHQCLKSGIPSNELCLADFLHYNRKEITRNFFLNNINAIVNIYQHCADRESRELFIANLVYQFTRDRRHYHGHLSELEQQYYEPDIIRLNNQEVYFDCGAKDGDTALAFHRLQKGIYKKIVTFEPDQENYLLLQENLREFPRVENINTGVGEREQILAFHGNMGGHSSFGDTGELQAQIVPLDRYLEYQPTFIKMDIEGFELSALKGAQDILQQCRPKLAICVYHKPCDIVELPKYILDQQEDYRVYFRLYRNFGHDLVCYCV